MISFYKWFCLGLVVLLMTKIKDNFYLLWERENAVQFWINLDRTWPVNPFSLMPLFVEESLMRTNCWLLLHMWWSDAFRTILREEGWRALYKGIVPSLFLVSHGAIQFTSYEELRKVIIELKAKGRTERPESADEMLNSVDYAILGASSKLAAILMSYPFQVIRTRLQQRPYTDGTPRYMDTWHVVKETARFEGLRGFYKGITPNILKNVPASSITFIVYENVMKLLRLGRTKE